MIDEQEIRLQRPDHSYRTEIPNIITEMRLTPYEMATYVILKKTAGDEGACFKSTDTLCQEIGIGRTKYVEVKKSLCERGLIEIEKRIKEDGSSASDLITIVNMWDENAQYVLDKKKLKKELCGLGGPSRSEGGVLRGAKEVLRHASDNKIPLTRSHLKNDDDACARAENCGDVHNFDDDLKKNEIDPDFRGINYISPSGKERFISKTDIYRQFTRIAVSDEALKEAIARAQRSTAPIGDMIKYLEVIARGIDMEQRAPKKSPAKVKCPPRKHGSESDCTDNYEAALDPEEMKRRVEELFKPRGNNE